MIHKPDLKCVGGTALKPEQPQEGRAAGSQIALPSVLDKVRVSAREKLAVMLNDAFDAVDDVFFDLAERSNFNQEQQLYFETMRAIRLRKKSVIAQYFVQWDASFSRLKNDSAEPETSIMSSDSLSLLQHDELEQNVAVDSMAAKARNEASQSIYQLTARLDAIIFHATVNQENNPFDPKQICEAFRKATLDLECNIKHKLILFKLFEKHLLKHYKELVADCNQILIEMGVLPDLKSAQKPARNEEPKKEAAATEHSQQSTADQGSVGSVNQAQNSSLAAPSFFDRLQNLLGTVRINPASRSNRFGFNGGNSNQSGHAMSEAMANHLAVWGQSIGSTTNNAQMVTNPDLVSLLSDLQQAQPSGQGYYSGELMPRVDVRNSLGGILTQQEVSVGPRRVAENDTNVIDFVSMLFEFILSDDNLPARIKALLGRLQIPMLKVAIIDASFFNMAGHPARKLLNEMARAGVGVSETADLEKDTVFKMIQSTVQNLLDEFSDDVTLFQKKWEEFTGFMQQESRRAAVIEQRTKASEEGKALSDTAKSKAASALMDLTRDKVLPEVVVKIIEDVWHKYLYLTYLKHGSESSSWRFALKTANDLIASVTPAVDAKQREKLYSTLPILDKALKLGFKTISFNPFEMGELLSDLDVVQKQVLREEMPEHLQEPELPSEPTDQLLAAVSRDMAELVQDIEAPVVPQARRTKAAKVTQLDVSKRPAEPAKPTLPELAEDDVHLVQAKAQQVGSWMEYIDTDGTKTRCKLAAFIRSADKMIFVNKAGIKVSEKCALEFAYDLKSGNVSILDDSLLFDRALENVIGNLKKIREKNL